MAQRRSPRCGICVEDGHPIQRDTAALSMPPILFARCPDCIEDGGVSFLGSMAIGTEEICLVPFESRGAVAPSE